MKNYLADYMAGMQKARATGATVAPRWNPTGDNQAWFDTEFARKQVADDFDRSMREREMDILASAFKAPERRNFEYRQTQFTPQDRMPQQFAGQSGEFGFRRGAQAPEGLDNFLASLMSRGGFRSGG